MSLSTEEFNSAFLLHLNALSKSSRDEMLMELGNQNVITIYFSNNLKISCHILNFTSFGKNLDFSCDPCLFVRDDFFFLPVLSDCSGASNYNYIVAEICKEIKNVLLSNWENLNFQD